LKYRLSRSTSRHESRQHHRPRPAWTHVPRLWLEHLFALHPDAATKAIMGGLLLLIGRCVPLGLTLLGSVIVNILLFHIFLEPSGLPMAIVVAVLALFRLWRYRTNFAGLAKP
jgi:putative oxidoreductase